LPYNHCSSFIVFYFFHFFDFFNFAVKNLATGARGMDALFPMPKSGRPAGMPAAAIHEFLPRKNSKL
jgi:hypothetical protein